MKKGFTLIEILAVVTIMGLIFILVIPKIGTSLKHKKKDVDTTTNNIIVTAAKKYVADNHDKFDKVDNNIYCLPLTTLTKKDYLDSPVKNVTDDLDITNSKSVKITYNKGFKYEVVDKKECMIVVNIPCESDYCDSEGNGYTEVEYLESTGTQYIDTEVVLKPSQKIDVNYYINSFNNSRNYVFGVYNGYRIQWSHANNSFAGYGDMANSNLLTNNSSNKNRLVMDKGVFYLNSEKIYDASSAQFNDMTSNSGSIYLFSFNNNGNAEWLSSIRIYDLKIYDNYNLIRDYVPVVDSTRKPCLFDIVEKKCYYNQGTGEFVYPKDISEYSKINYLESTGTQYIDTKLLRKKNIKIDVEYYVNNFNNNRNYVFGMYDGYRIQWSHANNSFAGYGDMANSNLLTNNSSNKNRLVMDKGVFYLNSEKIYDASSAQFNDMTSNSGSIYLFSFNNNGNVEWLSSIRIYSFEIYEDDILARDYIPVLDSSDRPCLYDQVEKKCYYNQGTGEFLYG